MGEEIWLWTAISQEPVGTWRSVMARSFGFFMLFHFSPTCTEPWKHWTFFSRYSTGRGRCFPSYGHFCEILAFLRCPLIKYGHVTWPKKQISKLFYFVLILHLISEKVTKFLVEKLSTSEVISQIPHGGWKTPPSAFRVKVVNLHPPVTWNALRLKKKVLTSVACYHVQCFSWLENV